MSDIFSNTQIANKQFDFLRLFKTDVHEDSKSNKCFS